MDSFVSHVENTDSDGGSYLPTFFEMFMQERILHGIKPAVKHIVVVLVDRWPRLASLMTNFDEIYAAAMMVVEGHHLWNYDGLLSEHLYGLCRGRARPRRRRRGGARGAGAAAAPAAVAAAAAASPGPLLPLDGRDRWAALLLAVLVPYLKEKLDKLSTRFQEEIVDEQFRAPLAPLSQEHTMEERQRRTRQIRMARLKRLFVGMYPIVHAGYEGSFFVYQWLYLVGRSPHFSPLLALAGHAPRRLAAADLMAAGGGGGGGGGALERAARWGRAGLVVGLVAFKLLEWWHQGLESGELAPAAAAPGEAPPPPLPIKPSPRGLGLGADRAACPLCRRRPRALPAALPSGYVFCYACALGFVRDHGRCPVTELPCAEGDLRRIYEG